MSEDIDYVYRDGAQPDKIRIRRLLKQLAGGTGSIGDYRGAWNSATAYIQRDIVQSGGSLWWALVGNTNVTPVEGATWTELLPSTFPIATQAEAEAGINNLHGLTPLRGYQQFGYRYIRGLTIAQSGGDPDNDITVAVGRAADIGDAMLMKLGSALTKRLDAAWAVGNNFGGLDTGSKANSTWYHVWLIGNPTSGVVDALFSTSATNPTMPSGYTCKRRIGSIKTDSSGNILDFINPAGGEFYWTGPQNSANNLVTGAAQLVSLAVPSGFKLKAVFSTNVDNTTADAQAFFGVSDPDVGNASTALFVDVFYTKSSGQKLTEWTDTLGRISVYSSIAGRLTINTRGWIDMRDAT